MPSNSKKQKKFMAAVAHSPSFAKKVGVPMSVGKEFNKADKSRKFKEGGEMAESKKMVKKEIAFMEKKGAPKSMIKHEKAEYGMKNGGISTSLKAHAAAPASKAHSGMKHGGLAAGHKSVDGIATKGKTKGMQVAMKRGGKVC